MNYLINNEDHNKLYNHFKRLTEAIKDEKSILRHYFAFKAFDISKPKSIKVIDTILWNKNTFQCQYCGYLIERSSSPKLKFFFKRINNKKKSLNIKCHKCEKVMKLWNVSIITNKIFQKEEMLQKLKNAQNVRNQSKGENRYPSLNANITQKQGGMRTLIIQKKSKKSSYIDNYQAEQHNVINPLAIIVDPTPSKNILSNIDIRVEDTNKNEIKNHLERITTLNNLMDEEIDSETEKNQMTPMPPLKNEHEFMKQNISSEVSIEKVLDKFLSQQQQTPIEIEISQILPLEMKDKEKECDKLVETPIQQKIQIDENKESLYNLFS